MYIPRGMLRYAGKGKLTLIACLSLDLWGQVPIRGQWWVVCEPKRGGGGRGVLQTKVVSQVEQNHITNLTVVEKKSVLWIRKDLLRIRISLSKPFGSCSGYVYGFKHIGTPGGDPKLKVSRAPLLWIWIRIHLAVLDTDLDPLLEFGS